MVETPVVALVPWDLVIELKMAHDKVLNLVRGDKEASE